VHDGTIAGNAVRPYKRRLVEGSDDNYYEDMPPNTDDVIMHQPTILPSISPSRKPRQRSSNPTAAPSAASTVASSKRKRSSAPTAVRLPPSKVSVTAVLTLLSGSGTGYGAYLQPILYLSDGIQRPNATSPSTASSANNGEAVIVSLEGVRRGQAVHVAVDSNGLNATYTIRVHEDLVSDQKVVPTLLVLLDGIPQVSLLHCFLLKCSLISCCRRIASRSRPPVAGGTTRYSFTVATRPSVFAVLPWWAALMCL